jgi:carbonic anhydrase
MTTQNINITSSNIAGNCDYKCSYNFKYSESSSTANNTGISIDLTYDSTSTGNVLFNNQKYTVGSVLIFSPSIHYFNGATMDGEIVITHNPVSTGNILEVCIPLTTSGDTLTSSVIIQEIIQTVASNAPSEGETTNLNISNFNLQNIVPKSPYFYYSDNNNTNWIVFGSLEAIPLGSSTISTLQQIIKPFPIPTPGNELFYNSKGPISGISIGDGIYISCQPTGSTDEETAVTYDKQTTSLDFSNILQSPVFLMTLLVIVGIILFVIIFYGISVFYSFITSEAPKLPSLPKLT